MIRINAAIAIEEREIEESFVRASGPGGQNVNKVSSAVQLRFDLAGSSVLSDPVKMRLRVLGGRRITTEGALLIIARNHRTQEHNRREAEERLADLVRRALVAPKARKATRVARAAN